MARLGAVILDFDGLLADTEGLHSRTWRAVLAEHGIACSEEEYGAHWIRGGRGIEEFVAERRLPVDARALLDRKLALHLAALDAELRPMPGALEFVARLRGRTRLALVTSGRWVTVGAAMERLGLSGAFDACVSYESVTRRKPHPEPMLRAAEMMGVAADRCVALDDAEKGIVAAAEAGMTAVAVPNEHTRGHDFSRARLVAPSLADLTFERLEALLPA